MIFNDYSIDLNEQKEVLDKIGFIIDDLKSILQLHENWVNNAFSKSYLKMIHSSSNNFSTEANALVENTFAYFNELREKLIGIDFLDFGEVLSNFRNIKISGLEDKSEEISNNFKNAYKTIHEYKKYTDYTKRAREYNNFISALNTMVNTFESYKFMVDYLNHINIGLNKGIEADTFEIRLLNETFNKDTYKNVTEPMYIMYDKLSEISNLTDVEPLKIVRMETGSFLINFFGDKSILKVIGKILETSHNIFIRNYTREGKKQNLVESTELFKQQFDIVNEMRELGLNVHEHDEIAKETLVLLMKQSNILLSSSPDIKINKKVLSKSQDIKKALECEEFISLPINDEIAK